jgi:hypothetical protein
VFLSVFGPVVVTVVLAGDNHLKLKYIFVVVAVVIKTKQNKILLFVVKDKRMKKTR